jgi:CTP:molybdopterin cytidylyltransferase MocA
MSVAHHQGVTFDPSTGDPTTVAVVLAAGAGSRFQGPTHKLAAPLGAHTVLHRVLTTVVDAGFAHILVVTGALRLTDLDPDPPPPVTEIHHPGWSQGQATTIQVAIREARKYGATAVVIGLGDQPGIPVSAWQAVASARSPIAVATYAQQRANPVRLAAEVWDLLPPDGDEGARSLMRVRPDLVQEVPCEGNPGDIDTVEDLDLWN